MESNRLIIIAAIVVVLAIIGYYVFTPNTATTPATPAAGTGQTK
jgi:hypothetical protein